MEALRSHRIAQVANSGILGVIKLNHPDIEIIETTTIAEALELVSAGKVEAYIGGISSAAYHIAKEGLTHIIVVGETPYKQDVAMAVRKDLPILSSIMKKAVASITLYERAEISRNWLSLKIENKTDFTLIRNIILAAAGILIINLLWVKSLKREVDRREQVEKKLLTSQEKTLLALDKAEAAQVDAETANTAKSNFLANMSHEIRTPLNAIIGFSEAMLAGLGGTVTSQKHVEYLNDIKNSGEHLAVVINDILDLSKIEAGKWNISESEFFIMDSINDAFKVIENQAKHKNINFTIKGAENIRLLKIFGDVTAIKRVLINLLSNAVKFTGENGDITCTLNRCKDGSIDVEIKDTGVGIPQDRLETVLNPFEQSVSNHELNEEGTGLGLAIVKKLIEQHGGTFTLSSKIGTGTSATINIPRTRIFSEETTHPKTLHGHI